MVSYVGVIPEVLSRYIRPDGFKVTASFDIPIRPSTVAQYWRMGGLNKASTNGIGFAPVPLRHKPPSPPQGLVALRDERYLQLLNTLNNLVPEASAFISHWYTATRTGGRHLLKETLEFKDLDRRQARQVFARLHQWASRQTRMPKDVVRPQSLVWSAVTYPKERPPGTTETSILIPKVKAIAMKIYAPPASP